MSAKRKKLQHITLMPPGTPVGTPCRRLCDGKKSKTKGYHWSRPVCPACVTAAARSNDHGRYQWTWTNSAPFNVTITKWVKP